MSDTKPIWNYTHIYTLVSKLDVSKCECGILDGMAESAIANGSVNINGDMTEAAMENE